MSHCLKKKLIYSLHLKFEVLLPMYRQNIANAKKMLCNKSVVGWAEFFLANSRHSPLQPPKMSDQSGTLLKHSLFRVTNSDSSTYCATVTNFKLKVQIVNDLLGKNFVRKILLIWPCAQKPGWKNMKFQKNVPFRSSLICMIESGIARNSGAPVWNSTRSVRLACAIIQICGTNVWTGKVSMCQTLK